MNTISNQGSLQLIIKLIKSLFVIGLIWVTILIVYGSIISPFIPSTYTCRYIRDASEAVVDMCQRREMMTKYALTIGALVLYFFLRKLSEQNYKSIIFTLLVYIPSSIIYGIYYAIKSFETPCGSAALAAGKGYPSEMSKVCAMANVNRDIVFSISSFVLLFLITKYLVYKKKQPK